MTYRLIYPESYNKKAKKFFKKHPQSLKQYEKVLKILEMNPYHPSLRLHALGGKFQGLSSISINMSHRIVLELMVKDHEVILINVGSHDQVY